MWWPYVVSFVFVIVFFGFVLAVVWPFKSTVKWIEHYTPSPSVSAAGRNPAGIIRTRVRANVFAVQDSRDKRMREMRRDEEIDTLDSVCLQKYNQCIDAAIQA